MKKLIGLIVPAVLACVGIYFLCVAVFALIGAFSDTGFLVAAPGSTIVKISKPGDYTLWNQTKTMVDGQFLTFPDQLPSGTTIKVMKKPGGTQIQLRPSMSASMEVNGVKRVSLGVLTFTEPGQYEVAVTGLSEKRSLYLDESKFLRSFVKFIGAGFLGLLFMVAAISLGIFVLIRFSKNKRQPSG